jgi:hypothetical protein
MLSVQERINQLMKDEEGLLLMEIKAVDPVVREQIRAKRLGVAFRNHGDRIYSGSIVREGGDESPRSASSSAAPLTISRSHQAAAQRAAPCKRSTDPVAVRDREKYLTCLFPPSCKAGRCAVFESAGFEPANQILEAPWDANQDPVTLSWVQPDASSA